MSTPAPAFPLRLKPSRMHRWAAYLRDLRASRPLIRYLTLASLQVETIGLWFGFIWWCLDPLLLMIVYTLVVSGVLHRGGPNFPVFVMSALLPWHFFVNACRNSMFATFNKTRAMRQVAFPRAVIPLATTLAEAFRLSAAIGLYLLFAILFGVDPMPIVILVVPLLAVLTAITLGFAYFFSALNVLARDTQPATVHLFRLWFFLAPVLYSIDRVPVRFRLVYQLDPFTEILEGFRSVLFYHQFPSFWPLTAATGASLLILVAGFAFFVSTEGSFAKKT